MDKTVSMEERFQATLKLAELRATRRRSACVTAARSRRPRAYYRKMKMSRIALRELGSKGLIQAWSSRAGEEVACL